jgi:hypothetical protein
VTAGIHPDVRHFVEKFIVPREISFVLDVSGRDILAMNDFLLILRESQDDRPKPTVRVVICTDVIFVAEVLKEGFYLMSPPVERTKVKLFEGPQDWDESLLRLELGRYFFTLEAQSEKEKHEWIELIASRDQYIPTSQLTGFALLNTRQRTREDLLGIFEIEDPMDRVGADKLKVEWRTIPKVDIM